MAPPTKCTRGGGRNEPTNSQSDAGRKRKHPDRMAKLREYGLDLPDIPGLPVQVIPLQLAALQATAKFFQNDDRAKREALPPYVQSPDTESELVPTAASGDAEASATVVGSILHRLGEAEQQVPAEQARLEQERLVKKTNAIETWLQAIHRSLRDAQHLARQREVDDTQSNSKRTPAAVPLAALKHVWNVGNGHKRIRVRRAALHCAGHLLQKSSDCRRWLLQGESSVMADWINVLSETERDPTRPASDATRIRLWQREAFMLLEHLLHDGYDELYPTLTVGMKRLKQLCPTITEQNGADAIGEGADASATRNMADWRRLRDVALRYAGEEERRVRKLLQRAQACLDIIVPRMGVSTPTTTDANTNAESTTVANDDGDGDSDADADNDIDWEDGWNDDVESDERLPESHADAVERTLAVIETTAGLKGGELSIEFSNTYTNQGPVTNVSPSAPTVLAWSRLHKCVRVLSGRHMPRLSAWAEGLNRADTLTQQQANASAVTSFVTMPQDVTRRRKHVLEALLELKSSVASILQSAQRLGIEPTAAVPSRPSIPPPRHRRAPVAINLASSTLHQNLSTSFERRRRVATPNASNSHRIQIKYRMT